MRGWWGAVLVVAVGCGPAVPNLDTATGSTIVCLGDSLTAGVGRGAEPAYPDILAAALGERVVNAGVPGDTSSAGLGRLDAVLAHDPWLIVIALGGNDILRRLPLESTEAALAGIVEGTLAAGAVPLLIEVRGPFGGRYADLFDRLESRYRVPVVRDALPRLLLDRRYKSDGVHLNGEGYRQLGLAIADAVRPLARRRWAA